MQHPTIKIKMSAFADWYKDETSWFTRQQFAHIIACAQSSIGSAIGWLRRNGFIVTSIWVHTERRYIYNIRRGESDQINSCAKRTRKSMSEIRQKLRNKVGRF